MTKFDLTDIAHFREVHKQEEKKKQKEEQKQKQKNGSTQDQEDPVPTPSKSSSSSVWGCLPRNNEQGQQPGQARCVANKATFLRFGGLCLITVVLLCIVYAVKQSSSHHDNQRSLESAFSVGDSVYARDLWLIIEYQSDSRGRRTKLGRATRSHICAAIKAAQQIGWTPLLVGAKSRCCRSKCRRLHPVDVDKMNFRSSNYLVNEGRFPLAMKTSAFLSAIRKGAHFIFQSNPEVYYLAGVGVGDYQAELERQLRKITLGISVALVKDRMEEGLIADPYVHFGGAKAAHPNGSFYKDTDRYKVCEVKPPSMEKFLESKGVNLDLSAPSFTLSSHLLAPFDSRNTVFGHETFWGLLLIELHHENGPSSEAEMYILRSIIAQRILAEIKGNTRFGSSPMMFGSEDDVQGLLRRPKFLAIIDFVSTWTCSRSRVLECFEDLVSSMAQLSLISARSQAVADLWVKDLMAVNYRDIDTLSSSLKLVLETTTEAHCIGSDYLDHVYFHPSPSTIDPAVAGAQPSAPSLAKQELEATLKGMHRFCPAVDIRDLKAGFFDNERHEKILLVITFFRKEYTNLPLLEVLYRPHFKNILYCGEPDDAIDGYFSEYSDVRFSFLPAHSKTGYECILGAIEMGYKVDGFLLINQDTLVSSWNLLSLNRTLIWHGNEHAREVTSGYLAELDVVGQQKVLRSAIGILNAFQFLEDVLLGPPGPSGLNRQGKALKADDSLWADLKRFGKNRKKLRSRRALERLDWDSSMKEKELEIPMHDGNVSTVSGSDAEPEAGTYSTHKFRHISLFGEIIHDEDDDSSEEDGDDDDDDDDDDGGQDSIESDESNDSDESSSYEDDYSLEKDIGEGNRTEASSSFNVDISDGTSVQATIKDLVKQTSGHKSSRNVTELLFHPANFNSNELASSEMNYTIPVNITAEQGFNTGYLDTTMLNMEKIYQAINEKLHRWAGVLSKKHKAKEDGKNMELLQCDTSANAEICHIVASFFSVLQQNVESGFKLFHDDLPIYFVPATFKDRLYLMANIFTKYQVDDELAFPLLLRGLADTSHWATLKRSELGIPINVPELQSPKDLLFDATDEASLALKAFEGSHYIYPVNMTNQVLRNEGLKDVLCRNFS